jgi:hypothetical protein
MILNIQQNEYLPFVTQSAGVRLAIRDDANPPWMFAEGLSLTTGMETNVAMQKVIIIPHVHMLNTYLIHTITQASLCKTASVLRLKYQCVVHS